MGLYSASLFLTLSQYTKNKMISYFGVSTLFFFFFWKAWLAYIVDKMCVKVEMEWKENGYLSREGTWKKASELEA